MTTYHLEAPQQLPGTQPLTDGVPPQHVEPPLWLALFTTGGAGADMRSCTFALPQDLHSNSSEFRPIPTSSSLCEPHSPHTYSFIGIFCTVPSRDQPFSNVCK
jgi:hypothetical protein